MATTRKVFDKNDPELNDEINARADARVERLIEFYTTKRDFIRHPLSRVRTITPVEGDSMTHQSHADSCDINNIIRQFDRTGILPPARKTPQFADVTHLQKDLTTLYSDLQDIGTRINDARAAIIEAQKNPPKNTEPDQTPKPAPTNDTPPPKDS